MMQPTGGSPMTTSFGPWTTAIDSGSRAALSTFWKRRMNRLPALGSKSPRVSRVARAGLVVCAAIAFGWPTLYVTGRLATAADQENVPSPDGAAKPAKPNEGKPGGPLLIPLPGGVHAELIGLADHTAK